MIRKKQRVINKTPKKGKFCNKNLLLTNNQPMPSQSLSSSFPTNLPSAAHYSYGMGYLPLGSIGISCPDCVPS